MLAGVALGAIAAGASAQNQLTLSDPGLTWRVNSFGGGAFLASHENGYIGAFGGPGGGLDSFLTFCMERNENVGLPQLNYATIDTSAMNGGIGGGTPDPLDTRTAALYAEFRGANTFGGTAAVALGGDGISNGSETRALQRAIWFLENEIGNAGDGISDADFEGDSLAHALYLWAVAHDTGDIGSVRVLRLWSQFDPATNTYSGNRQDQLTIVPLPPAAWAGIGSLAGVAAICYVRRRKQLS
jgi:hypothetical protein